MLAVVYLVFNEGHVASAGDDLAPDDLCVEAIRLAGCSSRCCPTGRRRRACWRCSCCWWRRLRRPHEALVAYDAALARTDNRAERDLLRRRRTAVAGA